MSVPSIPKDQFLAIKQLWQTKLQTEEKIKSLEAICNIQGNLRSILENLTKEFRAIPGSSISDTTGGSTVVDPATINHELLGGLLGGATNDHQHITTAEKANYNTAYALKDILTNDTGFINNENVIVTGNTTTRKVTLTGTGWAAYYKGVLRSELTTDWVSDAHGTDTAKSYFLAYNGTYQWFDLSVTALDFSWLLICYAFYDATAGTWLYMRDVHGLMDDESHKSDHLAIGTFKISGGTPSGTTLDSTTAANRRPLVSEAVIRDEDVDTTIAALATAAYTRAFLTSTGIGNFAVDQADIVNLSTNQPYYNEFTGGAWQQTLMPANSVMSIWAYMLPMAAGVNCQKYRIVWGQGQWITQAQNSSAGAMAIATTNELTRQISEMNLGSFTSLLPEMIGVIRIVVGYVSNNWVLKNVSVLTGSRYSQVSSPSGAYLSTVAVDDSLTGNGTPSSPLSVSLVAVDTASIDLTVNGRTLSANALPAGIDHSSLANLTTGDPHTQYAENAGSITQITTRNHNDLQNHNAGADLQHMTAAQIAALHAAVTVVDTASIDLTIAGQTISGAVLPAGVDHNSLANLTTGDPHTQYTENSGSITQITTRNHSDLQNKNTEADVKHLTDAQVSALHAAVTVTDTTSVDLTITGQTVTAAVLPAGVDHNSLANLTTGDPHTQYTENSGSITQITTRNHNDLSNLNGGADYQHMTAAQIAALHAAVTVVDTASIDLTIAGQTLSGAVLPAGVDHNSLNNLNAGATYQHLTTTQVSALHAKQHAIDATADHTSAITAGKGLIANANGLPTGSAHVAETATGVGIGTTTPAQMLEVKGIAQITGASSYAVLLLQEEGANNWGFFAGLPESNGFKLRTDSKDVFQITGTKAANSLVIYNGNTGIGTTTPAEKLEVASAAALDGSAPVCIQIRDTKSSNAWTAGAKTQALRFFGDDESIGLVSEIAMKCLDTGGAKRDMAISLRNTAGVLTEYLSIKQAGGNVGIGTTTPAQKVEISGEAALDGTAPIMLRISDTKSDAGWTVDAVTQGIEFYQGDLSTPGASVCGRIDMKTRASTGSSRDMNFSVYDGDASLIEAMTIKYTTGRIGIGTATPASLTEIQGGLTTVGSVLTLSTKEPTVVANDVLGDIDFKAPLSTAGSDSVLVAASITAVAEDTFSTTVNATSLEFRTGASEAATTKMTVKSDGKVGVGTTTPAEKLEVVGTVKATAFSGPLTGNVTGNASGTAATVTGAAQTAITSVGTLTALQVDNININGNTISSTAGTDLLITPLEGQQIILDGAIEIDAGVVTGATSITSTAFVGALTGNASGSAATVTTAAQPNITSVGTLTGLAVNGAVAVNNENITISRAVVSAGTIPKIVLTGDDTTITNPDAAVEFVNTDATYATTHKIYLMALRNDLVIENKKVGANYGKTIISGDTDQGTLWIGNAKASPALNDVMGNLVFGTQGGVASHLITAYHGDYGTGKTGGGKIELYQRNSGDTFSLNLVLDGLNRRMGINTAAPGYPLDVTGDINSSTVYKRGGTQVVGAQGAAVADATDASSVILRLNDLLARLRTHGLIAT